MATYTNPVSNLSYTNKDFQTIYPELLDLVKKLTYKWDPSISNESDPGVILLKLNAIIADKNNYNIDKNVLECFPLSVTQTKNARQLFEQLGYSMQWYIAASTTINFNWKGTAPSNRSSVLIPAFTMICDDENSIVFTLLEETALPTDGTMVSRNALQGIINQYTVNGETVITAADLDSNNRLYFTEQNVAQNGIFINSSSASVTGAASSWARVDTLANIQLGQKVFKFGIDVTTDTCFIEFPEDADELIDSGISIKYLTTDGQNGNVARNIITKFYDTVEIGSGESAVTLDTSNTNIKNNSPANDGKDPESIDDAYINYKKTVGTFDTIVTLRDYFNALVSGNYASNGIVCDRTNDIQSSYKVVTGTSAKQSSKAVVKTDADGTPELTAFDLKLYLLQYKNAIYDRNSYDATFTMIEGNDPSNDNDYYDIRVGLANLKSIQHDYAEIKAARPVMFKNKYPVSCKVIVQYEVTEDQAKEIQNNVRDAIYQAFNSQKISFGQEILYEDLYKCIIDSDERIKAIILEDFSYTTYYVYWDASEKRFKEKLLDDAVKQDILAYSALAGVTSPITLDTTIPYTLQYNYGEPVTDIASLTTYTSIEVPAATEEAGGHEIPANESLVFFAPSLITKLTYATNTRYNYTGTNITHDVDYKLAGNDTLTLTWIEDNIQKSETYKKGTIINSSIDLSSGAQGILNSTGTISIKEINTVERKSGEFYWLLNKQTFYTKKTSSGSTAEVDLTTPYFVLFAAGKSEYTLQSGEYFLYIDRSSNTASLVGAGTKLTREGDLTSVWQVRATVNYADINAEGLDAFTEDDLFTLPTGATVTEMEQRYQVIPAGYKVWVSKGSKVTFTSSDTTDIGENTTISWSDGGQLVNSSGSDISWKGTAILSLNCSPSNPQKLTGNETVTVTKNDGTIPPAFKNTLIIPSAILAGVSGDSINTIAYDANGKASYLTLVSATDSEKTFDSDSNTTVTIAKSDTEAEFTCNFGVAGTFCIPIVVPNLDTSTTLTVSGGVVKLMSSATASSMSQGTYYLSVTSEGTDIKLTFTLSAAASSDTTILIKPVCKYISKDSFSTEVLKKIGEKSHGYYNWLYEVPSDVEIADPIEPKAFLNSNHIYNKFTICQADDINIDIINRVR